MPKPPHPLKGLGAGSNPLPRWGEGTMWCCAKVSEIGGRYGAVFYPSGNHGDQGRGDVRALPGDGSGLQDHGGGRQRDRRRSGHVLLRESARAAEQWNWGRGADAHLLGGRPAGVRDQRHGVVAEGLHPGLVPRERDRPDTGGRVPAGVCAGGGRHVGGGAGPLRDDDVQRSAGTRHRAG